VDVRDDAATGDGALDEGVELLIPKDGELQVAASLLTLLCLFKTINFTGIFQSHHMHQGFSYTHL